jgi:hypothetical protein
MFFIEFVGKDLGFFATIRAFAAKGFEIFKLLITGAMLGCGHKGLLTLMSDVYCLLFGVFRTAVTPKS